VHINPNALKAAYGSQPEATMQKVVGFIDKQRIVGIDAWLADLVN
jgi:hypothetical protein